MDEKMKKMVLDAAEVAHAALTSDALIINESTGVVEGSEPLSNEDITNLSGVIFQAAKLQNEEERIKSEFREKTSDDRKLELAKILVPAGIGIVTTGLTVGVGALVTMAVCRSNAGIAQMILGVEETGVVTSKAFGPFVRAMMTPKLF